MRSECGACGRSCKLLPGGFGHRPGRHYDRSARCLAKLGGGVGPRPVRVAVTIRQRVKRGPELRGGVRSPNREPRWSAERRARFASAQPHPHDAAKERLRLSALRLPSCGEGCLTWWTKRHAGQNSGAKRAARTRSAACAGVRILPRQRATRQSLLPATSTTPPETHPHSDSA
jgi:hypothetical protein